MKVVLTLFVFFCFTTNIQSQTVVAPDCSDAVNNNICTNASFQIDPNGAGLEELNGSVSNPGTNPSSGNAGCLLTGETNSTWMIVNISSAGLLEFSFGQDASTGCLDWIMWPYNTSSCDEIFNNTLPPISCNWNGQCEGFTGIASTLPPGGAASNFEPGLNVLAGEQYLICLSNYSSQSTTLPLNFFGSAGVSCSSVLPVTVNSETICPGDQTTLTATGANSYLWSPNNETTASITVSPSVTTTYTVTGTETLPNGVVAVGIGEGIVTVLAANDPQCSCSVSATNNGPICFNGTFDLTADLTIPGVNDAYSWEITGTGIGTGQTLTSIPALAPGTWPIQVSATDDNGFVCTDITQLVILSSTDPLCSCDIIASNTGPICYNATFSLSATSVSNGTYLWDVNGTPIGSGQDLIDLPAMAPGLYPIQVTATDDNGFECSSITQLEILSENNSACSCTVTASNTGPICINEVFDLGAESSSSCTYEWALLGTVIGTGQNMSNVPGGSAGSFSFEVTAIDDNGFLCSAMTEVIVNPLPSILAGPDDQICFGDDVTIAATGGINYNWFDGVQWLNDIQNDITFNISSNSTYVVEGFDVNGCSNSDTISISINAAQLPILSAQSNLICTGESVVLSNLNSNAETSSWYFSNNTETIGTNNPGPFLFSDAGCSDLTVTMVDNNGCDTSMTYTDVVCAEEATASFYISPGAIGPGNGEIHFYNSSFGAESYLWDFGDGEGSSLFEGPHVYDVTLETGYQASLIAFSAIGCADTISMPITYQEELIYYIPNAFTPDADEHNQTFKPVFTSGFDPYNYEIAIYNRWGEIVWKSYDHEQGWDGSYTSKSGIGVQAGIYNWVIKFKPKTTDEKIVIHGSVNVLK